MKNSLRLLLISVTILGLFTQSLGQSLDLLKELSIYKGEGTLTSGERVGAIERIESHFTKENLTETAKILIKDAANTVLSQKTDPYVQRQGLVSIGKMMGGGAKILKELLFEDPPFFTVFTTNLAKAQFIIGVMGELQLDDMRELLHSYVNYIVAHPDLFPLNRELGDMLNTTIESLFFLNHASTPQFFINQYLREENQTKKSMWSFLLMTFVKFQQYKHSRKRFLVIDDDTKNVWKAILKREDLVQREHDDFFIALHLLLLISSNMTIEEIIDYKSTYYMDYFTVLSKRRLQYLEEAMENISELYRIHLTPSGNQEISSGSGEEFVKGFTQLALLFLGCLDDIGSDRGSQNNFGKNENIRKYNEVFRWLMDCIDSVRFPKPNPLK